MPNKPPMFLWGALFGVTLAISIWAFFYVREERARQSLHWAEHYPVVCRITSVSQQGPMQYQVVLHDFVQASRVEIQGGCQVLYLGDIFKGSTCEKARVVCSPWRQYREVLSGETGKASEEGDSEYEFLGD